MMAPTFRSRFAQPSRRLPIPGANESSTVEWHSAHWMPTEVSWLPEKKPVTPDDRVELQEQRASSRGRRGRRLRGAAGFEAAAGRALDVHLQAERQRRSRASGRARPRRWPRRRSPHAGSTCRPRTPRRRRCRSGRFPGPSRSIAPRFSRFPGPPVRELPVGSVRVGRVLGSRRLGWSQDRDDDEAGDDEKTGKKGTETGSCAHVDSLRSLCVQNGAPPTPRADSWLQPYRVVRLRLVTTFFRGREKEDPKGRRRNILVERGPLAASAECPSWRSSFQFTPQEPGPRGSPHEPQPAGASGAFAPPPPAPTAKTDRSFSSFPLAQPGHRGRASPSTNSSKRRSHSRQRYS